MWVTSPHMEQGIELGKAWDLSLEQLLLFGIKWFIIPQYTFSYCEMCLVFKRGKIPTPRGTRNEKQLISVPRGKHSQKPIEVLEAIQRMFPTQDRIELFDKT